MAGVPLAAVARGLHLAPSPLGRYLLACALLAVACASPPAAAPAKVGAPSAGPPAAALPAAAVAQADATSSELPNSPVVNLNVAVQGQAHYGPFYIAQDRGYLREVGLEVEFTTVANVNEQIAALAQGQLHVGSCVASVGCFNALNRRTDLQIVADILSAGRSDRSRGSGGLVVRKDLWDSGAIRGPHDLVGRSVYLIVGEGSQQHALAVRWLLTNGVDLPSVEFKMLGPPEQLVAFGNGAIEVGYLGEPLLSVGLQRGFVELMASQEQMNPNYQGTYVTYWSGIERMGPMVGERFMVAYLRGVRDYINAIDYGIDQDTIVEILAANTVIKDPAVYRSIQRGGVDPNGRVNRANLEADAELFRQVGQLQTAIDLSGAFEDKYRQFAVQYLGEYSPPR